MNKEKDKTIGVLIFLLGFVFAFIAPLNSPYVKYLIFGV
jgi:hypothetical protein